MSELAQSQKPLNCFSFIAIERDYSRSRFFIVTIRYHLHSIRYFTEDIRCAGCAVVPSDLDMSTRQDETRHSLSCLFRDKDKIHVSSEILLSNRRTVDRYACQMHCIAAVMV